jgi:hypothetical protein
MQPAEAIEAFLARYTPEIAAQLQQARNHLATQFPRGFELVYDNYNALVFVFAASPSSTDAIVSVAGYPRWVTLFFARAGELPDPNGVLEGSGAQIRGVRLRPPARLREPAVQALIHAARQAAQAALADAPALTTRIKSVSARQRSRKPADAKEA